MTTERGEGGERGEEEGGGRLYRGYIISNMRVLVGEGGGGG